MILSKDNPYPAQGSVNKGHRCVGCPGLEPSGHRRNFQNFSQRCSEELPFTGKNFRIFENFNERFAAFSKVL